MYKKCPLLFNLKRNICTKGQVITIKTNIYIQVVSHMKKRLQALSLQIVPLWKFQ